jgi:Ca-activated chloride channel family protein
MMCRFRFRSRVGSGPVTTVILTERSWIDYNQRELGVGARCEPGPGGTAGDGGGGQPDSAPPLIAFYPEDTLELDQVFVRLDWVDGGSPQGTAAAQFGEWLGGEPGRRMLREEPVGDDLIVGARAVGTPPDQDRVSSARLLQRQADPSGRLLVLVDTSGSMDQPTDADTGITRIEVAAEAVSATLDLMIPGDAFGLWTFPGPDQARVRERVPIEIAVDAPAIERHRQATDRALDEIRVGGATPLFAAIAEAVEVLRRSDDERITALVVVTDGADTGGGQTAAGLEDLVRADGGPRVFVIAVGEATCTNPLVQVTHAGGGQCHPGSFDDLDRTLRNVARTIWGGDGDDQ